MTSQCTKQGIRDQGGKPPLPVIETHTVPDKAAATRLDRYASTVFAAFPSKKAAHKGIRRGRLLVNGSPAVPNQQIQTGQCLELLLDDRPVPPVYDFPLTVILEDAMLAVIEKPPGIPVSGNYARTVERALGSNLSPSTAPDALLWARPVHRLDAPTGGLLLIAKTALSIMNLSRQFQEGTIDKRYLAMVTGKLTEAGTIVTPIEGRRAETHYQPLEHIRSLTTEWLTLVFLTPKTGRTHQLRRHLAELGHPVLGDQQYKTSEKVLRSKGLFLWSVGLVFTHPGTGERQNIMIDPPAKFASLKAREERRWRKFNGS